jgi:molybdopterin molybdotransferase
MNIHPKGQDAQKGDVVLSAGQVISPAEIALLASVGKSRISVKSFPMTALVSTGDELVEVNQEPAPHQIRRSNTRALKAAMKEIHWNASSFHLPDNKAAVNERLREILNNNEITILSGGVSKGKFDFIPDAMESLGVRKQFHEVSQRPGKPFWFGTRDDGKVVFALPGNPVSTYVCFYRYILPWIFRQMEVKPKLEFARLGEDFSFTPDLTYFLQVRTKNDSGAVVAYPRPGGGSGDFANLTEVDGFLELPREKSEFKKGEVYPYFSFRH